MSFRSSGLRTIATVTCQVGRPALRPVLPRWGRAWLVVLLAGMAASAVAQRRPRPPDDSQTLRKAWLSWSEGREADALAALQELVERNADDPDLLADLAAVFATGTSDQVANTERAVDAALSALAIDEGHRGARLALAEAHQRKGEPGRAVSELVPLLMEDRLGAGGLRRLHYFASAQRSRLDREDDASLRADSLFVSGLALAKLARYPDAVSLLEESLALVPGRPPVIVALARARRQAGQATGLDDMMENVQPIGALRLELGRERLAQDRLAEAEAAFRQALAEGVDPGVARAFLALALEGQDRLEEALAQASAARALLAKGASRRRLQIDHVRVDLLRGRLYEALGRLRPALQAFLDVVQVPGHPAEADAGVARLDASLFGAGVDRARLAAGRWPGAVQFVPMATVAAEGGRCLVADLNGDDVSDFLIEGEGIFVGRRGLSWRPMGGQPPADLLSSMQVVDLDGDSRPDLLDISPRGMQVWHNRGGRFRAKPAALTWDVQDFGGPVGGVTFGDLDLDGQIDGVFVELGAGSAGNLQLRIVQSLGSREPVARAARAIRWAGVGDPVLVDLDDDGYLDFVAPSALGDGVLLAVERSGRLGLPRPLVAEQVPGFLAARPGAPRCFLPADLDGDGITDLLVVGTPSDQPGRVLVNRLRAGGEFRSEPLVVENAPLFGIQDACRGDVDNDGRPDLVIVDGQDRLRLLIRQVSGMWRDATWLAGLDGLSARSVALADLDQDGDLDLVLDGGRLFSNSGNDNDWISLRLQARGSAAIGARLTIQVGASSQHREVGLPSLNPVGSSVHIGLGRVRGPIRAAIRWSDGRDQFLRSLEPHRRHVIKEPR